MKRSILYAVFLIITSLLIISCGLSQKEIDEIDSRIQVLIDQGAPDSLLSSAKVFLFQVKAAKKSGNSGILKKNGDSLVIYIDKAEANFKRDVENAKPYLESTMKSILSRKKELTGLQLKLADSVISIIDSLKAKNWLLPAQQICFRLDTLFPHLLKDEELAQKYSKKLVGRWVSVRIPKGFKAKETRIFTFKKNNEFHTMEEMKGQTSDYLKEDWKFINIGKWGMRGDTVKMNVTKENCVKQVFWNFRNVNGKNQWVKTTAPTYDSTITDGKKDRFITYAHLADNFKRR
ncbi:MAG: hypothetical protein PVI26_12395, partial [Chitinispirillia bacterium]